MTTPLEPVRSLWIGPSVPPAQAACMASFVRIGHPFELYTYGEIAGIPAGVTVRDGRDLMPESEIFSYGAAAGAGQGSVSSFSNIFRYKLLHELGGYWVDTDVFCLRPFPRQEVVVASDAREGGLGPSTCVLRFPAGNSFAAALLEVSLKADRETLKWGQIGPDLVFRLMKHAGVPHTALSPPEDFCPIPYRHFQHFLEDRPIPENAYAVHLWNEMWRRTHSPIVWPGPAGSMLARLAAL